MSVATITLPFPPFCHKESYWSARFYDRALLLLSSHRIDTHFILGWVWIVIITICVA